jgi:spermidine/putrescine transport system ATP-binding protein
MVSDAVIRLEQVAKFYGSTPVIEHLNLDVQRGEFLTLLGPSGCGKTTTLRMIAGFETPSAGRILLDGVDVSETPPYRRPLNTVFQQYALFPHMTVADNIAFGPRTSGVARAEVARRVQAALEMVAMTAHAHKRPGLLSGGQQQRVALARALVNQPAALLLDEPLSALDVKLRHGMQVELKRIQAEVHTTFIFVTHDQDEALTLSSRIAVMNGGRIEQLDTPETIYNCPATPFVAGFIGHANLIPARVENAAGRARLTLADGATVQAACPAHLPARWSGLLMLRPEALALRHRPADGNGFAATVRGIEFQGAVLRYDLQRADGQPVVASVSPHQRLEGVGPGDTVWGAFAPEQAWVVPEGNP